MYFTVAVVAKEKECMMAGEEISLRSRNISVTLDNTQTRQQLNLICRSKLWWLSVTSSKRRYYKLSLQSSMDLSNLTGVILVLFTCMLVCLCCFNHSLSQILVLGLQGKFLYFKVILHN